MIDLARFEYRAYVYPRTKSHAVLRGRDLAPVKMVSTSQLMYIHTILTGDGLIGDMWAWMLQEYAHTVPSTTGGNKDYFSSWPSLSAISQLLIPPPGAHRSKPEQAKGVFDQWYIFDTAGSKPGVSYKIKGRTPQSNLAA